MGDFVGSIWSSRLAIAVVALMFVLAGLDLAGAVLAKEWGLRRNPWLFCAGMLTFVLLFVVYAGAMKIAEMSTVTFGWIVILQVAVLMVERLRYGVDLPAGKWVAIAAILVLQGYLILAPAAHT